MTTNDFRVGDIVSVTGTVTWVGSMALDIDTDGGTDCIFAHNAVLVERPEPKYSVELTYDQLDRLCERTVNIPGFGVGQHPIYEYLSGIRSEVDFNED